jgi:hypothetical protein
MPPQIIKSLNSWDNNARAKQLRTRAGVLVLWGLRSPSNPIGKVKRTTPGACLLKAYIVTGVAEAVPEENMEEEAKTKWLVEENRKIALGDTKDEQETMAVCEVLRFDGEDAECLVKLSGYELPCVSFPAKLLRNKGLSKGGRFIWTVREGNFISPADIDTHIPQTITPQLPPEQQAELERLDADSRKREAEGEDWTEDA